MTWTTKADLRERIEVQKCVIDNLKAEIASLKLLLSASQAEVVALKQRNLDDRDKSDLVARLLTDQVDFWKSTAMTLLDKEAIAATGAPTFRHAPSPSPEPSSEAPEPSQEELRAEDEGEIPGGIPRAAILRNPRRHTAHVTMQQTIEHNRRETGRGIKEYQNQVEAALREVDRKAKENAAKIPQASADKTA